jgi:AraC-like DNA-binding protein
MPRPVEVRLTAADTLLFSSPLVAVGEFVCRPEHPEFAESGPVGGNLVVFARRDVEIEHQSGRFVNSSNVASYYRKGTTFRRSAVDPAGVHSSWFALAPDVLQELTDNLPTSGRRLIGPRTYLRHAVLIERLRRAKMEALGVEETALDLARAVLTGGEEWTVRTRRTKMHELIEETKAILGHRLDRSSSLSAIAGTVGVSPFHLSRAFRRHAGLGLHEYRQQLRLRRSLELLRKPKLDLLEIALSLGYNSHSHFTSKFRRAFGITPSQYRSGIALDVQSAWSDAARASVR